MIERFKTFIGSVWHLAARELRSGLRNRVFHLLGSASLLAGCLMLLPDHGITDRVFLFMQLLLFGLPLLGVLLGTGTAWEDHGEGALLFSTPLTPFEYVAGKFVGGGLQVAGIVVLLVLPAVVVSGGAVELVTVLVLGVGLGACFFALGQAAGWSATGRVRGFLHALGVWLVFLAGLDLLALLAGTWSFFQERAGLWIWMVLMNPLDSFRLSLNVQLEEVTVPKGEELGFAYELFLEQAPLFAGGIIAGWTVIALMAGWWFCHRNEL